MKKVTEFTKYTKQSVFCFLLNKKRRQSLKYQHHVLHNFFGTAISKFRHPKLTNCSTKAIINFPSSYRVSRSEINLFLQQETKAIPKQRNPQTEKSLS